MPPEYGYDEIEDGSILMMMLNDPRIRSLGADRSEHLWWLCA